MVLVAPPRPTVAGAASSIVIQPDPPAVVIDGYHAHVAQTGIPQNNDRQANIWFSRLTRALVGQ